MKQKKKKYIAKVIIFIIAILFSAYLGANNNIAQNNIQSDIQKMNNQIENKLNIHFIDVGQGDSILIQKNDNIVLIDAGENDKGDLVVNYLKEKNITKIDYLIGTHADSDHIGRIRYSS